MDIYQSYPNLTKEYLNNEYFTLNKSKSQICKEQNISVYNLDKFFKVYDIKLKPQGSHSLTSDEEKINLILQQHPYATKEFLYNEYITLEKSLPDLQKEYNITYDHTLKLLKFYNIPKRSISQATKTKTFKSKLHTTLQERYGVSTNISQVESVKIKKLNKCLDQYGVDNFFKKHDFKKIKNEGYIKKYGMDFADWKKQSNQQIWSNKTSDEKNEWLNKSILADSVRNRPRIRNGYSVSKAEGIISDILALLKITHTRQYPVQYYIDNKKKYYYYDFYIPELNLLIEYNGDYWHANPALYKADDLIKYPGGVYLASDRWDNDKQKQQIAIDKKFIIITIWESEINKISKPDITQLIKQKIEEYIK